MAGMAQEFKAFVMRGNVLDLAVGVVIGAAFGKIVSSFVGDILMPPLGLLVGGVDMSHVGVTLKAAAGDKVRAGQPVASIEAMKMEAAITAPGDGVIERVAIGATAQVEAGDLLVVIRPAQ